MKNLEYRVEHHTLGQYTVTITNTTTGLVTVGRGLSEVTARTDALEGQRAAHKHLQPNNTENACMRMLSLLEHLCPDLDDYAIGLLAIDQVQKLRDVFEDSGNKIGAEACQARMDWLEQNRPRA